jgi:multidrug resistance efflux pump
MVGNVDAEIRPKVEGFLLTRLYTKGSYVEKGQPMFQLDKRQAQAAVEQATGNLELILGETGRSILTGEACGSSTGKRTQEQSPTP